MTGDVGKTSGAGRDTFEWIDEVQDRGAGELVLNCMNQDGVRRGYDLSQLRRARRHARVPLIASGGAGAPEHFAEVFLEARVDGALAASVFHSGQIPIGALKRLLAREGIDIRPQEETA